MLALDAQVGVGGLRLQLGVVLLRQDLTQALLRLPRQGEGVRQRDQGVLLPVVHQGGDVAAGQVGAELVPVEQKVVVPVGLGQVEQTPVFTGRPAGQRAAEHRAVLLPQGVQGLVQGGGPGGLAPAGGGRGGDLDIVAQIVVILGLHHHGQPPGLGAEGEEPAAGQNDEQRQDEHYGGGPAVLAPDDVGDAQARLALPAGEAGGEGGVGQGSVHDALLSALACSSRVPSQTSWPRALKV